MHRMVFFIEHIGATALRLLGSLRATLSFALAILVRMFAPHAYNSAMRTVLIRQLYFTSVEILPLFITVSVIVGSVLIGIVFQVLKSLGLTDLLGHILMGLVVTELSPFLTVILLTLRSSSAINAEIAVMNVSNELRTLAMFRIDTLNYLFLPRILNGIISVVLLSVLFSIVVLISGLLYSMLIFGMSLDAYIDVLINALSLSDLIILFLKCATLGFFIALIPILSGVNASRELTGIPIAVLQGMVRVFIAVVIIEVLSLILRFI